MARRPSVTDRINTELGALIVARMHELGINWAELATRAGMTPEGIKQICTPESNPSIDSLVAISSGLDLSVQALLEALSADGREIPRAASHGVDRAQKSWDKSKASLFWDAYLELANKVQESSLPEDLKPKTSELIDACKFLMAC